MADIQLRDSWVFGFGLWEDAKEGGGMVWLWRFVVLRREKNGWMNGSGVRICTRAGYVTVCEVLRTLMMRSTEIYHVSVEEHTLSFPSIRFAFD